MKKFFGYGLFVIAMIAGVIAFIWLNQDKDTITKYEDEEISIPVSIELQTEESTTQEETVEELPTDIIETYEETYGKTTSSLNLREYPSTDGSIYAVIGKKQMLQIKGKTRNEWYIVAYDGMEGYVSSDYVQIMSEEEVLAATVKEEFSDNTYGLVMAPDGLNIREEATTSSNVKTRVLDGSILKVYAQMENGWYKVEGNTYVGYSSSDYVKVLTPEEYNEYSILPEEMYDPENNIVATFETQSSYGENSRHNMHLAADYINGTVIQPGQTYSHLQAIHPGGEEGYVVSTIYNGNGEATQGIGGGVCQTSTTLYAALVYAQEQGHRTGMVVSQRKPHSGSVSYAPRKYEATVSTGSSDLCFRNCNNFPVAINASYDYNTLRITIRKAD